MPATAVSGASRTALIYGSTLACDIASATAGQTRVAIVALRPGSADLSTPSGWTQRLNAAHSSGDPKGRLVVFTKSVGSGGESSGSQSFTVSTGTVTEAVIVTDVIDGTFKVSGISEFASFVTDHVAPSVTIESGVDDLGYMGAATAEYPRTYTATGATERVDTATTGGPTVTTGTKSLSGSSSGTATFTADSTEQGWGFTLAFAPLAGSTVGDFIGDADTLQVLSVTPASTSATVAASATADIQIRILGTGNVPIVGVNAVFEKQFPTGDATATQVAVTDADGYATMRITGGSAGLGTITPRFAGVSGAAVSVTVTEEVGASLVRFAGISSTMATVLGSAALPTTGWAVYVYSPAVNPNELHGSLLFVSLNQTLVSDGAGGLKFDVPVPSSVTLAEDDPVIGYARRSTSISAQSPTEESGWMAGVTV